MRARTSRSILASLSLILCGTDDPGFAGSSDRCIHAKPPDVIFLQDIEPSIVEDMRYASANNFVGRPLAGYPPRASCMLTRQAADALKRVQLVLQQNGLSLKVYDCYRPDRAVRDIMTWAYDHSGTTTKSQYYPRLDKKELGSLGYLSNRSPHSRGSTVDLTIVPHPSPPQPARVQLGERKSCIAEDRAPDSSLDFGTGFDCFDELSHTHNPDVGEEARRNRAYLVKEMARAGFRNYPREWWHFELVGEPHGEGCFDFPVKARQPAAQP